MSYYLHETPGRLRLRTPVLKDNPAETRRVSFLLSGLSGIQKVTTNATTGSVTIHFCETRICAATIINCLSKHGFVYGLIGFPRRRRTRTPYRRPSLSNCSVTRLTRDVPVLEDVSMVPARMTRQQIARPLSPQTKKFLHLAAKIVLPILAERAFGKTGKEIMATLL